MPGLIGPHLLKQGPDSDFSQPHCGELVGYNNLVIKINEFKCSSRRGFITGKDDLPVLTFQRGPGGKFAIVRYNENFAVFGLFNVNPFVILHQSRKDFPGAVRDRQCSDFHPLIQMEG